MFKVPLNTPSRHLRRLLLNTSLPRCRRSFWGCSSRLIRKISSEQSSPTMTSYRHAATHSLTHTHTQSQCRLNCFPDFNGLSVTLDPLLRRSSEDQLLRLLDRLEFKVFALAGPCALGHQRRLVTCAWVDDAFAESGNAEAKAFLGQICRK